MQYKLVKIGEIGNVITGNTPSKSNKDYYDSKHIPFIKPNNFNKVGITELFKSDEFLSEAGSKAGRIVNKGSVLVTCIGTIGNVGVARQDICFNQQINAIEPNLDIIDNRYLAYSIIYRKKELKAIANAPVVPIINKTQFSAFEIPLPPLETQKKIVEVLDKAQALIDTRKEQIKLLDDLIQSTFYDMFGDPVANSKGWEISKINDFIKIDTKMVKDFEQYADYPHIGIDNIEKNTGKLINFRTVKEDNLISGKYLFRPEHIIYSKIRPNLNKVALPTFHGLCSADSYPLLVNKEKANRIYVALILRSDYFLSEILKHSSRTNIPKVNKAQLLSFECIVPPLDIQNQFAEIVQKIESEKQLMEKSLEEMENNFNSLMQRAFKGELFS